MGDAQKRKARERWAIEEPLQKEARDLRGIYEVPADDKEYDKLLEELKVKLALPKPPAMPVLAKQGESLCETGPPLSNRQKAKALNEEIFRQRSFHVTSPDGKSHVERIAPRGHASEEWFACVHTPLPIPKALQIPAAREALEAEWRKLESKKAWDVSKVAPKLKLMLNELPLAAMLAKNGSLAFIPLLLSPRP